ncbi:hypothetical protein QTN25_004491 [Entamoeba marina]
MDNLLLNEIPVAFFGPPNSGKTSIIHSFAYNTYPSDHIPTLQDTYHVAVQFGPKSVKLCVADTSGSEEYQELLDYYYATSKIVVFVYAVDDKQSIIEVEKAIDHYFKRTALFGCNSNIPLMIIGNKIDKVSDRTTTWQEGNELANNYRGICQMIFLETSALNAQKVKDVFYSLAFGFDMADVKTESSTQSPRAIRNTPRKERNAEINQRSRRLQEMRELNSKRSLSVSNVPRPTLE